MTEAEVAWCKAWRDHDGGAGTLLHGEVVALNLAGSGARRRRVCGEDAMYVGVIPRLRHGSRKTGIAGMLVAWSWWWCCRDTVEVVACHKQSCGGARSLVQRPRMRRSLVARDSPWPL